MSPPRSLDGRCQGHLRAKWPSLALLLLVLVPEWGEGGREGGTASTHTDELQSSSIGVVCACVRACVCFSRSPQGEALGMPCSVSARHCWTAPRSSCRHKEGTQGKHSHPLPPTPIHSQPLNTACSPHQATDTRPWHATTLHLHTPHHDRRRLYQYLFQQFLH